MRPSRRQALRALAAAPAAAFFPIAPSFAAQENDVDADLTPAGEAACEGLMSFALGLHGHLSADGGNVVASPWSVWTALAMLAEGARGATRAQIVAAMGLDGAAARGDNVRAGSRELHRRLARASKRVSVTTADAIWVDEMFDLRNDLARTLSSGYDAELTRVDFRGEPNGARQRINDWTSKATKERIEELIPEGAVGPATELVLADAIHFKGSWLHAFDEERTREGAFKRGDGTVVRAQMMRLSSDESFPLTKLVVNVLASPPRRSNCRTSASVRPWSLSSPIGTTGSRTSSAGSTRRTFAPRSRPWSRARPASSCPS